MRKADQHDLAQFLDEFQRETERGLALVGAAVIDDKLRQTLNSFFCDEATSDRLLMDRGPLQPLSARADACLALGLIDAFEHHDISLIRKIRNEFAHAKHGVSFRTEKIRSLCASLKSEFPDLPSDQKLTMRSRFTYAVVSMLSRLYYRPESVEQEKRAPKTWVAPDDLRWRKFDDGPPRDGQEMLVIWELKQKSKPGRPGGN